MIKKTCILFFSLTALHCSYAVNVDNVSMPTRAGYNALLAAPGGITGYAAFHYTPGDKINAWASSNEYTTIAWLAKKKVFNVMADAVAVATVQYALEKTAGPTHGIPTNFFDSITTLAANIAIQLMCNKIMTATVTKK